MAEIVWEYQCRSSKWLEFDADVNGFLNTIIDGPYKAEKELEGWRMEFDLQQMRQRNVDSGFMRSIRCAIRSPNNDGPKIIWSYQGEPRKRWTSFPPKVAIQMEDYIAKSGETSDAGEKKMELELFGRDAQIDFRKNILTILDTEEERPIKRIESNAGPPDTSDPPHPTKSSPSKIRERAGHGHEEMKTATTDEDKPKRIRKGKKTQEEEKKTTQEASGSTRKREYKKKIKITEQEEESLDGVNSKENDDDDEEDDGGEASDHLRNKRKKLEEGLNMEETIADSAGSKPEVDIECKQLIGTAHVYTDSDGRNYDAMLNQTNIQQNNNKFYLMQILENNVGAEYWVWFRWGRVGFKGQTSLTPFRQNLDGALQLFHKKFWEKTHNEFLVSREGFEKVHGKYDLIRIDYTRKMVTSEEKVEKMEQEGETAKGEEQNGGEIGMDERVKKVMGILCDLKTMETEARRLDYDFKRIPLGKITKEQIKAGYEALTRIEKHIRENNFNRDFAQAVNEYYTRIPHSFGMRTPPMINTTELLKQEIDLLDLLTGIEIAVTKIAGNPLESHYSRLKWELVPLEKDDHKYALIEEYLLNTQGPTHDRFRLGLRNVFELHEKDPDKNVEKRRVDSEEMNKRRMLLWHGSRLTNWYSILAQGLRIAPPEAPVTGYMFGKGVYFADFSSKSANYSLAGPDSPGFMLLSEVSLGETLDLRDADDQMHLKLPTGKHSVRGVGQLVSDPKGAKMMDGVEVPCGKPVKANDADHTSLIYNEYIVYNLGQIRERFLVEIEYNFDFQL